MTKKIFFYLALVFCSCATHTSQTIGYADWINKADSFYHVNRYREAANAFTQAFIASGGNDLSKDGYDHCYNAACVWAHAGNNDSAFFMLMHIATKANYAAYNHLLIDDDLTSLHADKRWVELIAFVKQNREKTEPGLDKELVASLDTIFRDDQQYRAKIEDTNEKYGIHSKQVNDLWEIINAKDSINLIKVKKILDKYGWAGPGVAGVEGNKTIFLVIQHADIKTREKYLPMMREAVKNKKAEPCDLALLEDRVALEHGKKQIYGSQVEDDTDGAYYVAMLEDPDNVDKRRAEVGLPPMAENLKRWGLKWDPEAYKKQLPELEKKNKKNR